MPFMLGRRVGRRQRAGRSDQRFRCGHFEFDLYAPEVVYCAYSASSQQTDQTLSARQRAANVLTRTEVGKEARNQIPSFAHAGRPELALRGLARKLAWG